MGRTRETAKLAAATVVALLLAAFFGFVGYSKAFARLSDLERHGAWTIHLPEFAGRLVGWSEMIGSALLVASVAVPRLRPLAVPVALYFIANQLAAAAVHAWHGEAGALPQNAVIIAAFIAIALVMRGRRQRQESD